MSDCLLNAPLMITVAKQKLFSVLAKKTQLLFLTMAVLIKSMIKYNEENDKTIFMLEKSKRGNWIE